MICLYPEPGTNTFPELISVIQGQKRGYCFIHKIGTLFYHCRRNQAALKADGTIHLICNHSLKDRGGCRWTGAIINISGLNQENPNYWFNTENWTVLPKYNSVEHTCCGVQM